MVFFLAKLSPCANDHVFLQELKTETKGIQQRLKLLLSLPHPPHHHPQRQYMKETETHDG